jgi:DNA-binding response OmpR family regulator
MSAAPLKVLVIDDEPPIRKLLRMGLSTQGYEILEAPNARTSLQLLAQNPDLVILDLGLPDIQGLELLRMIRARNESVPIVVLSSRGDEAGKVEALDLGADDYVTNSSIRLSARVHQHLCRREASSRHPAARTTPDATPSRITAWRPGTRRFICSGGCPKLRLPSAAINHLTGDEA